MIDVVSVKDVVLARHGKARDLLELGNTVKLRRGCCLNTIKRLGLSSIILLNLRKLVADGPAGDLSLPYPGRITFWLHFIQTAEKG